MEPVDLERSAMAAYLAGEDEASDGAWARAHQAYLDRHEPERAARCAFWLAFGLMHRGERARAGGWIARAQRLIADGQAECVERGYLLLPEAMRQIAEGENRCAHALFGEAAEIGARFADPDLVALARHGQGRALIRAGEVGTGMTLLDETMVAVEAGEVSPIVVGDVYCSVIEACEETFDVRRAREWTAVLTRWCETQPQFLPYRGNCLVRRAEILQLQGEWNAAIEEARRARDLLARPPGRPAAGSAWYRIAELHRLRGEFADAEAAYREAARWGRRTQPGLALLRLAQGRKRDAVDAIRRALAETRGPAATPALLDARVEIALAAADPETASNAADELTGMAEALDAPMLLAAAARCRGAVLLDRDDPGAAMTSLRDAGIRWEELQAPYETARARLGIGLACHALGDEEGGWLEFDAARAVFQRLGAMPDLARVPDAARRPASTAHGLSPRELQVLRLLAAGRRNKAIAEDLFISPRTVERHVSNIFTKLGVASRAAATAFAHRNDLV